MKKNISCYICFRCEFLGLPNDGWILLYGMLWDTAGMLGVSNLKYYIWREMSFSGKTWLIFCSSIQLFSSHQAVSPHRAVQCITPEDLALHQLSVLACLLCGLLQNLAIYILSIKRHSFFRSQISWLIKRHNDDGVRLLYWYFFCICTPKWILLSTAVIRVKIVFGFHIFSYYVCTSQRNETRRNWIGETRQWNQSCHS